jgi:hypothetical protein
MQRFPWKVNGEPEPTYFREKILAGVKSSYSGLIGMPGKGIEPFTITHEAGEPRKYRVYGDGEPKDLIINPKLHTLRADPHDRWKAGRKIEMVYRGAGYKIIDHFNKGIPEMEKCVSTQKIEIKWVPLEGGITEPVREMHIIIDGKRQEPLKTLEIATNDGFADIHRFARWFNKDFTGKIIHWTTLKY